MSKCIFGVNANFINVFFTVYPSKTWSAYNDKNQETRLYKFYVNPADGNSFTNKDVERDYWVNDDGSLVVR